jgi:hypothetical protein
VLDALLAVGPLASGASQVVLHGLEATPDFILPDRTTPIIVLARSSTSVTFRNDGPAVASAYFLAWKVHSIQSHGDQGFGWQGTDVALAGGVAADLVQVTPRWTDLQVPESSFRNGVTAPALTVFKGGTRLWAFSEGDEVEFTMQMPHSWKLGTAISPHIHCAFPNTNAGNYVWGLEYTIANIGGVFGDTATLESAVTAAPGVAFKHTLIELEPDVDMSGALAALSTMLACRLYRKAGIAGAYAADIFLLEADFHYQMDTLGSAQEFIK